MAPLSLRVNLGPRSYDIVITTGDPDGLGRFARERHAGVAAVVVTDENAGPHAGRALAALAAAGYRASLVSLPAGEETKSLCTVSHLYDRLAEANADRRTLVVAVGGGVIGDAAGFAAATFLRGLPLLMAPTTLLAMVDSSVGGKVGVNHFRGKNLIGAFHQPMGVWIDTATLDTLPEAEYRSGLAEVVKYGVILDADLFAYLEECCDALWQRDSAVVRQVIARCCRLKADVVEKDEREEIGLRTVLNYGHTFAHAFETIAGYGAWRHGEAVAAGMACAAQLAVHCGFLDPDAARRQQRLLERLGLPIRPLPWPVEEVLAVMRRDKKATDGRLRFVLPQRIGETSLVDDVPEDAVRDVWRSLLAGHE